MSNGDTFYYADDHGNRISLIQDVVRQEVTVLCCQYIEENDGKKPSREQIEKKVKDTFDVLWKEGEENERR